MDLLTCDSLEALPFLSGNYGLTIGSFDGVHLGHQALIHSLRSLLPPPSKLAVLTFTNHPSGFFHPQAPVLRLTTPSQKVELLQKQGVDLILQLPFNAALASLPYEQFLHLLKEKIPFSSLVLGEGARFGKNKQGDEAHVKQLSPSLNFKAVYLPKLLLKNTPVSSGRIRSLIFQGALKEASSYLGRPYSLRLSPPSAENFFSLPSLCLPPTGTYHVVCAGESTQVVIDQDKRTLKFIPAPPLAPKEVIFDLAKCS